MGNACCACWRGGGAAAARADGALAPLTMYTNARGTHDHLAGEELQDLATGLEGAPHEITVHIDKLPPNKTDTYAAAYVVLGNGERKALGRTETVGGTTAQYATPMVVRARPEEGGRLEVDVHQDVKGGDGPLIGTASTPLGRLLNTGHAHGEVLRVGSHKYPGGMAMLLSRPIKNLHDALTLEFTASNLTAASHLRLYVVVHRTDEGRSIPVAKTATAQSAPTTQWPPLTVRGYRLNRNDQHVPLQMSVYSASECMGTAAATTAQLLRGPTSMPLNNQAGRKVGELLVRTASFAVPPSLAEFVSAGLAVRATVVVDFSATNMAIEKSPSGLHFVPSEDFAAEKITPPKPEYAAAIDMACNAVQHLVAPKPFAAFGFGATPKALLTGACESREVFNLGCGPSPAFTTGADVVAAYHRTLREVSMDETARLAGALREVAQLPGPGRTHVGAGHAERGRGEYQVVFVLTDGELIDVPEVRKVVADLVDAPIAVVILGMGDPYVQAADFERLAALGKLGTARESAWFTPFRMFLQRPGKEFEREVAAAVARQFGNWLEGAARTGAPLAIEHMPNYIAVKEALRSRRRGETVPLLTASARMSEAASGFQDVPCVASEQVEESLSLPAEAMQGSVSQLPALQIRGRVTAPPIERPAPPQLTSPVRPPPLSGHPHPTPAEDHHAPNVRANDGVWRGTNVPQQPARHHSLALERHRVRTICSHAAARARMAEHPYVSAHPEDNPAVSVTFGPMIGVTSGPASPGAAPARVSGSPCIDHISLPMVPSRHDATEPAVSAFHAPLAGGTGESRMAPYDPAPHPAGPLARRGSAARSLSPARAYPRAEDAAAFNSPVWRGESGAWESLAEPLLPANPRHRACI
eukprot:TRINITY_DN27966_c0_g1_i1.p1 TRINITY_DN27966_c0_g1~~TRINITY_DN27966_c0_g1_i1.p1  ORF type:complete len:872 (+),score=48.65 TRINITY_DN27966_c0_g1_i1:72-2687(+)